MEVLLSGLEVRPHRNFVALGGRGKGDACAFADDLFEVGETGEVLPELVRFPRPW